jgi:hypothetical protein
MHGHSILVTGAAGRVGSIGPAIVEAVHPQNRYDRCTHTVERLTGIPPMSIAGFVRRHAAACGMATHH